MEDFNSETKADGLNQNENKGECSANVGVRPIFSYDSRPIRKRAYHRALKRGETWAKSMEFHLKLNKILARETLIALREQIAFNNGDYWKVVK